MKTSLKTLIAAVAFGASALITQAQPVTKILVVDVVKLLDGHYKTEEQNAKLMADQQKAREELDRLLKEGQGMAAKLKEVAEQAENPALTAEARSKAQSDAQAMYADVQKKENEFRNFQATTENTLRQRVNNVRGMILDEISKTASEIAKKKGATLLLDKSGPTAVGLPPVIYSDPSYDITDEVLAEINKGRPAAAAAPAAAKEAAPNTVTFPGAKK